jgi:outer membrane protein TolC
LDQVVNMAVSTNTNVVLAKQRYAQAVEGLNQINAQGKPQLGANLADTYTTYATSTAAFGPVVANPVVPTGTAIPTVTDDAADFSSAFGVGTASAATNAFGAAISSPTGTAVTLPATNSSLPGNSAETTLPGLNPGTSSTTGAASTTAPVAPATDSSPSSTTAPAATPAPGAGSTSAPEGTNAPSVTGTSFNLMPMPLILQDYVTESSTPAVVADASSTNDTRTSDVRSSTDATPVHPNQGSSITTSSSTAVSQIIGSENVNNYGARVNLSQYIDVFGLLGAARDAEKRNRDFYALDIDRNQNEVALSAKNLFFNVILAEQQVATDQEQVDDSTESVRVTAALVQQGQAAGFDLLSAQTTLANNQQLLTSAKNQLSFAVSDLDYLLGIDPSTQINLVPPPIPPLNEAVDLQQSINVALQRRPEVIQANSNVQMAQELVRVANEGTTPTIGLVGTYGYNSTATVTGPENEGLLSAQIQVPFDDGGATRSRVREAKDALASQVTTRDELKLSVSLEVRQAYLNVLDGQTQASTAQTGVDLAVETLRVANVQYQNGIGTILDVENAQAQLATARTNLANAQYTYQTALAALIRDIGSR